MSVGDSLSLSWLRLSRARFAGVSPNSGLCFAGAFPSPAKFSAPPGRLNADETPFNNLEPSVETFLLYFHSHGSNRTEGRFLLKFASRLNMHLCLTDMRASGDSGGQYTTLGVREHRDIHSLVRLLRTRFGAQQILLYGRSMGAVSIMKFVAEFCEGDLLTPDPSMPKVLGAILDSPFWTVQKFFRNFIRQK